MNKNEVLIQFGSAVRAKRESLGLTQEELGFKSGIHRTYIGSVERGEKNISLLNIVKIASALEVKITTLL